MHLPKTAMRENRACPPARFRHAIAASLMMCASCGSPETKYQVHSQETSVSLSGSDVGVADEVLAPAGSRLLTSERTAGRFPAGICVVEVEVYIPAGSNERLLRLRTVPGHHAVYWSNLLDELPLVREVIFLREAGLDPRGYQWREVLQASVERDCSLCLIYSRLDDSEADAEYAGVLWDSAALQPLAVLRVPVILPVDLSNDASAGEEPEEPQDPTIREADFRAQQEFRHSLRDAIWDLARQDSTAPTTQPNPWNDAEFFLPMFPRDYKRYRDWRLERFFRESDRSDPPRNADN